MAYEQITPIQQLNFQINRVLTYGEVAGDHDEIVTALSGVRKIGTCMPLMPTGWQSFS